MNQYSWLSAVRSVPTLLIALLCSWIAFAFAPGHMDADALGMIVMAREGRYSDWYPPFLQFLFEIVHYLRLGPSGILTFQVFSIGFSTYWLLLMLSGPIVGVICTYSVLLCPAVLGYTGAITTHGILMAFLLPAFAGLLYLSRPLPGKHRIFGLIVVLILLAISNSSRVNGPAYTLPAFCVWIVLASNLTWRRRDPLKVSLLVGAGLTLTMSAYVLLNSFINLSLHVTGAKPAQQIILFDLAALSVKSSHVLLSPAYYPAQDLPLLERTFLPDMLDPLVYRGPDSILKFHPETKLYRGLTQNWIRSILKYPKFYLEERTDMIIPLLGLNFQRPEYVPFHPGIDPNDLGYQILHPRANRMAVSYLSTFATTVVDRPWIYVPGVLLAIFFFFRQKRIQGSARLPIVALATGSCLYLSSYFFAAPGALFRYTWPSVFGDVVVMYAVLAIYLQGALERVRAVGQSTLVSER